MPDVASTKHQEGSRVTYTDQIINCVDCGIDFVFSASEQAFFAEKGFGSAPKRCGACRAQRRALTSAGYGPGSGPAVNGEREMFETTCERCGGVARVPFRPTGSRPVYCSDCFRTMRD